MCVWIMIFTIYIQGIAASPLLYEDLKAPNMHPRTFYLTSNQEFQVISKVLCQDIPCPEFNVVQDYPYFIQQRSYRDSVFLTLTSERVCSFKEVLEDGLERLDKYTNVGYIEWTQTYSRSNCDPLDGLNSREEKYRKTLPILIHVNQVTSSKSDNPWCHMNYSINYYTPHYWGEIATPKEITSQILEIHDNTQIYAHTFDGNVENELLREIELFRRNLDTLGLCYKKMTFYVALYDIPHSPHDSRLELWFLKCSGRK